MDRATRKRLYNLCRPEEALEPGDPRYADVDALAGGVRGRPWAQTIAERITLSSRPVCVLCTGQPGAGATTELLRLGARLRDERGPNLLVVHIPAEQVIDLASPVHFADLLLALVQRSQEAVAAASGNPGKELLRRFRPWLRAAEPQGGWLPGERAAESLRANAAARARFRAEVEAERSRFVEEVRSELIVLNEQARRAGHGGLALVFDGLERLHGTSKVLREVLDSAERAFLPDEPTLMLPVPVVWTVPCALTLRQSFPIHWLPMIALSDRQGGRREAGYTAGAEILQRRVPESMLADLFGPEVWRARQEHLLDASGGSPREMVALLQECISATPLDDVGFRRVLVSRWDPWLSMLPGTPLPFLGRVHQTKALLPGDTAERELAERALMNGLVLRYHDDEPWYDAHPAVRHALGNPAAS